MEYRASHLGRDAATHYDDGFGDPRTAQGLTWTVEQQILDRLLRRYVADGASVLDFACGTGRILHVLEARFPRPHAVDVSPAMVEVARRKCPGAEIVVGDVTRQPGLITGRHALITAFRFFLNAEPDLRRDVLHFMHGALSPTGVLIANFHLSPFSARGLYLQARWLGRRRTPMLSRRSALRLLRDTGFEVLEVVGYDYLPYRRDGARQLAPRARARIERALSGRRWVPAVAGSFVVVARPG